MKSEGFRGVLTNIIFFKTLTLAMLEVFSFELRIATEMYKVATFADYTKFKAILAFTIHKTLFSISFPRALWCSTLQTTIVKFLLCFLPIKIKAGK